MAAAFAIDRVSPHASSTVLGRRCYPDRLSLAPGVSDYERMQPPNTILDATLSADEHRTSSHTRRSLVSMRVHRWPVANAMTCHWNCRGGISNQEDPVAISEGSLEKTCLETLDIRLFLFPSSWLARLSPIFSSSSDIPKG